MAQHTVENPKSEFGLMEDAWRREFETIWRSQNAHLYSNPSAHNRVSEMSQENLPGVLVKFERKRDRQLESLKTPTSLRKIRKTKNKA